MLPLPQGGVDQGTEALWSVPGCPLLCKTTPVRRCPPHMLKVIPMRFRRTQSARRRTGRITRSSAMTLTGGMTSTVDAGMAPCMKVRTGPPAFAHAHEGSLLQVS